MTLLGYLILKKKKAPKRGPFLNLNNIVIRMQMQHLTSNILGQRYY